MGVEKWESNESSAPLLRSLHPGIISWYKFRSKVLYPFQRPAFFFPFFTYGELFFVIPGLLLMIGGSFINLSQGGTEDSIESSGSLSGIFLGVAFATISHNSIWTFLIGIPFERALYYHKFAANVSVLTGIVHLYLSYLDYNSVSSMLSDDEGVSGILLLLCMLVILTFSFYPIRRRCFEVFLYLHWILFLLIIGFSALHGVGAVGSAVFLLGLDILVRTYVTRKYNPKTVQLTALPCKVLRIAYAKQQFRYKSGQYVFICVPKLGLFQWHPFSISSAPHEDTVTIHIRVLGNWTQRLYDMAKTQKEPLPCYIEGPYGEHAVDIDSDRYSRVMLISGGIGITPNQSLFTELTHQMSRGRPIRKLWFLWSVRDRFMVQDFYDAEFTTKNPMPLSFTPNLVPETESEDRVEVGFYLTKARKESEYEVGNIRPETQKRLNFGRMDLSQIFTTAYEEMANDADDKTCAVLVCGPAGMVQSVKRMTRLFTKNGVRFDFHSEVFDF